MRHRVCAVDRALGAELLVVDKYSCRLFPSPIVYSSLKGRILVELADVVPGPSWPWGWRTQPRYRHGIPAWELIMIEAARGQLFYFSSVPKGYVIMFPHIASIGVVAGLAIAPWIRSFSIRTLLIATTLIAVVLGAIVYEIR
jgi:hypothetical protein